MSRKGITSVRYCIFGDVHAFSSCIFAREIAFVTLGINIKGKCEIDHSNDNRKIRMTDKEEVMNSKVLVILSTAEKEKALTGIMYAANAQKYKWIEDLKVIFFGPFERLLCEDDGVVKAASQLLEYQTPVACKFISDREGITEKIEKMGFEIEYVGTLISDHIKEGYTPMVF